MASPLGNLLGLMLNSLGIIRTWLSVIPAFLCFWGAWNERFLSLSNVISGSCDGNAWRGHLGEKKTPQGLLNKTNAGHQQAPVGLNKQHRMMEGGPRGRGPFGRIFLQPH